MRLGRTTFLHFLSQVVVSIAGFASRFAIAFFLGEQVLGQYSVAVGLGFYWLVIPGTAVGLAINKRVSEGTDQAEYWTAGVLTNIILAFAVAGLVFGSAYLVRTAGLFADTTFGSVLTDTSALIALLAFAAILRQTVNSGLSGQKRVALVGGLNASERVLRTTLQIVFILIGFQLFGLLVGHAASLAVVSILAILVFGQRFARPARHHVENLFSFGKYAWLSALQGRTYGWMDVLVLSFFVSDGLIGIYEAAWGLASLLAVVSTSVQSTLFPEMSSLAVDEEYARIRHVLGEGVVFSGIFVIPGLVGAAIIGERVLSIYRPSFAKGATILVVLILAYAVDVYGSQFISALNALDRPDVTYRVNLGFIVLNVVLNVALIWQFGWFGAAVATFLSAALRGTWSLGALSREIGPPDVPLKHVGYEVVAALGMGVAIVPIAAWAPGTRLWTVVVVLAGATIYVTILLALSSLVRRKARGLVASIV
ncbi:MAG: O-antigen/teichoic acid export membrane protein [Natrialbaceae archaeon]|jgi:O-antigen/teichoic acid export membrane protein